MRDIAFACLIGGLLPVCFLRPWVGILVWSWLGYMNPHQFCYGFARSTVPWAEMVAIATISGFALTKDRDRFFWCRESVLMVLIWIWFTITTLFSWYPQDAWYYLERFSKILLMTLLTIPLIRDRARMRWLLLVIAGSLGFYGFKAGLFVIATGGNYMVFGAPGTSFVSTNNAIALALNMCLPLLWYLRKDETRRWLRPVFLAAFWLSALAVPFTYSRGGVLGLCCVFAVLFARSKQRYVLLPLAGIVLVVLFMYAPEKWVSRMHTLETYEQDASAMARLTAWKVGFEIANDRPLVGGGFWVFNHAETFRKYAPEYDHFIDAHSIYFNVLGEHGYVGFGLFISLLLCSLGSLFSMYRVGRQYEELSWVSDYSHMLGSGIVAYLVTGAFISVAYFDLAWHFFALVIVIKGLTRTERQALAALRTEGAALVPARARVGKTLPIPTPAGYRTYGPNAVPAGSAKRA